MKYQYSFFSPNPTSLIEMFAIENYLDEPIHTECKVTDKNFVKEFKLSKKDTMKQCSEIKEKSAGVMQKKT